jgi:hypothetical protein
MKKQKIVSLSIILVLMASMFICLEGIQPANAQTLAPMHITPADPRVFQRNGEIIVDSSCHLGAGLYLGVFQARLLRQIRFYTSSNDDCLFASQSDAIWVKTEQWDVNGWFDQDFNAYFYETLTLDNMDDCFSECPDTWDGIKYEVYYKVEWKYVPWPEAWLDPNNGQLIATTGNIDPNDVVDMTAHVVHNELKRYAIDYSAETYGYGGYQDLSNVLFAPDSATGYLYTYQYGDGAYFDSSLTYQFDREAYPECDVYDLYIYCGSWYGYPSQVTISYDVWNQGWETLYNFQSSEAMGWVYCGEIPANTAAIGVFIENLPLQYGGNLEIDSIMAWGKNPEW